MTPVYIVIVSDLVNHGGRYYAFSSSGNATAFINSTQKQLQSILGPMQNNVTYTTVQVPLDAGNI